MPRTYKRRPGARPYNRYSKVDLVKATACIWKGMSYRKASIKFNISKSVLFRHAKIDYTQNNEDVLMTLKEEIDDQLIMGAGPLTLEVVEKRLDCWLKPKVLAESWDNVGLLIGSTKEKNEKVINKIHLCNDLTPEVVDEAITNSVDMIVTYHPLLFSPIKRIAYGSWIERVAAKCLANDIVVYSPHTALDAIVGGVNDHYVEVLGSLSPVTSNRPITSKYSEALKEAEIFPTSAEEANQIFLSAIDSKEIAFVSVDVSNGGPPSIRVAVEPGNEGEAELHAAVQKISTQDIQRVVFNHKFWPGAGRVFALETPIYLPQIILTLKTRFGLSYVQVAGNTDDERPLSRFGVCAGSGASLTKECPDIDCFITGEMAHHDILQFVHDGKGKKTLIIFGHSESERHYMKTLESVLKIILFDTGYGPEICISSSDKSPLYLR